MPVRSTNENLLNGKLAELIDARAPDLRVQAETRRGGKQPDIFLRIDGIPVVIEAERDQTKVKMAQATKEADARIPEIASAAIALCYPKDCHTENIGDGGFIWAVRTAQTMKTAARWDFGGVDELVGELRHIRDYLGNPESLAAKLSYALDIATLKLSLNMRETIAESVGLPPDKKGKYDSAAKRALLVVANTVMFHIRLESYFAQWHRQGKFKDKGKPQTVKQCLSRPSVCLAFDDSWRAILEIDYNLIFKSARCITAFAESEEAVKEVARAALEIASDPASLRHDLLGGLFHRALDSAKYDGSFYTTPASAVLLAGLSVEGKNSDYKILDPSCGTGTLLMAAAERYRDLLTTGDKDGDLHRRIVENVIHGIDINITATQMAATTLGIISPKTDFTDINIHQAKFGVHSGIARLGALDYLADNGGPSLVSINPDGWHVNTDIEEPMPDYKDKIDLVIMNPPYTRADLRHHNMTKDAQKLMAAREKVIMGKTAAHQSSNGNNFIALADFLTRQNEGKFAAILPLVTATATTALGTRKFIAANYDIEYIIVPHDPERFWFSGGTAISEMMIVAKRREKGDKPKAAKVIALRHNPETPSMARRLARLIANDKKGGDLEVHSISPKQLADGDWTAVQFASPRLLRDFYKMRGGEFFGVVALGDKESCHIASPEPRYGKFVRSDNGCYFALWHNNTSNITSMTTKPDAQLDARKGMEKEAAAIVNACGRIKVPYKLHIPAARACASFVVRKSFGGWFSSINVAEWQEKPLCLFINSSFGILGLLGVKNAHKLPRSDLDKPYLAKLPVPVLTQQQAEKMSAAFDELSKETLSPLPQMADDEVRIKIDYAVADALKVDREVIDRLRGALATEPCISGKRAYKLTAS